MTSRVLQTQHNNSSSSNTNSRDAAMASLAKTQQMLRERLQASKSAVDAWAQSQNQKTDAMKQHATQQLQQQQHAIDTASAHLLALQLERGCHVENNNNTKDATAATSSLQQRRDDLENKVQQQTTINALLDDELTEAKRQFKDAQAEYRHQKARAESVQQQANALDSSKRGTVNDLTRGMANYNYLGLEFEKAEFDRMRFVFTQLDPIQPEQRFSFCLELASGKYNSDNDDDDEVWQIVDCQPPVLSEATLTELARPFNATNDLMSLVRGMRHAFVQYVRGGDTTLRGHDNENTNNDSL